MSADRTSPAPALLASWTRGERLAAAFFVAYLVVQIAVPTWKLVRPERPGRFGWQMFAGTEVKVRFVLILDSGAEKVVDPAQFQVARRLDLVPTAEFPPYLCTRAKNGRAVRVELPGQTPWMVTCPR